MIDFSKINEIAGFTRFIRTKASIDDYCLNQYFLVTAFKYLVDESTIQLSNEQKLKDILDKIFADYQVFKKLKIGFSKKLFSHSLRHVSVNRYFHKMLRFEDNIMQKDSDDSMKSLCKRIWTSRKKEHEEIMIKTNTIHLFKQKK